MPTDKELADSLSGKQLPAVTNGSQPQPVVPASQAWVEQYKYSREEIKMVAETAAKAGIFSDISDANKGIIRILWGIEQGFSPTEALNDVFEYKGRFYIYAEGVMAQLAKRGAFIVFTETTAKSVTGHIEDENKQMIGLPVTFTIEMAADFMRSKDGIKPPWKADPESMLCARVISRLNKRVGKRFWQTTVGVKEEIDDIKTLDAVSTDDPALLAVASAGKRTRKRTEEPAQEVEEVEGKSVESATSQPSAGPVDQSAGSATTKKPTSGAGTRSKPSAKKTPATKEQESQLIAALEEAGIDTAEWDEWAREEYGLNDDNYQEAFTVEVFNASMLWAQRAREEAEADAR